MDMSFLDSWLNSGSWWFHEEKIPFKTKPKKKTTQKTTSSAKSKEKALFVYIDFDNKLPFFSRAIF